VHCHAAATRHTTVREVEYYLSYVRYFAKHHGRAATLALAGAVGVATLVRMLLLPLVHPPLSRPAAHTLAAKLATARALLAQLPASVPAPGEVARCA
jgi:hypothetical protein